MHIESLSISGFMSFKQVRWKPERLNVLIGPNGSGKSNLLKALELIRASAAGDLRKFVLSKGGLTSLLWGGSAQKMEFTLDNDSDQYVYTFSLIPLPQSASYRFASEQLGFQEANEPFWLLDRDSQGLIVGQIGQVHEKYSPNQVPESETALSMVSALWPHPVPYELQQRLRAWAIYRDLRVDENAEIRWAAVLREERLISADGQNLVPVLKTLYSGEFRDAIDSGMSAAFPDDYHELTFRSTEPNRIQLYVRRKHGEREDSISDLSDGTLRFLLLLTILATPDPPPLIAIDEPEAGLHPSMLPIIAEFAAEAASRTQVVLSTHSPQMLDAFGESLPTATVFDWVGDHTELKTVTGEELKKWVAEYSLGRFMFSGEAQAVL